MWLFALFVAVPIVEIALFIQVGGWLGLLPTLAIVIATAALGTFLAGVLLANSDDDGYGGSNTSPGGLVSATKVGSHDQIASVTIDLPPLALIVLEPLD